ncbi:hypothetical protein ABNQ38_34130 (plasmid) [Azospirillum sp. A29]|jgi:hypothetical protein|uniref:hypothetical protein n=1 Tax=Azospirillum sp. A29 TaxID=3160606 RepID=UPI00367358DF
MDMGLKGKVAPVLGGSQGIGRAAAENILVDTVCPGWTAASCRAPVMSDPSTFKTRFSGRIA